MNFVKSGVTAESPEEMMDYQHLMGLLS